MSSTRDIVDAARLVAWGLRPKSIPVRDKDYSHLVRRYTTEPGFADAVKAVCAGMSLMVVDVNTRAGIVVAPQEDSPFVYRMEDYSRRASMAGRTTDKVIHGIAHLACAAVAFPRPADLADDTYVGYVTVDQVDGLVREACQRLAQASAKAQENSDAPHDAPELQRAWDAYEKRPSTASTKDGRIAPDTTRGAVAKALRFLADQGFVVPRSEDGDQGYRTTARYQAQVRELAANRALDELTALGVVAPFNPEGSLVHHGTETL